MHVLAARCDLESGKSLNIAPPGWEKTYGALRDWQNHENNWSRPDDPARARMQQPGHRAYIEAGRPRAGLAVEADPRSAIRDYLPQRVEQGEVRDRAGVVDATAASGQRRALIFKDCTRFAVLEGSYEEVLFCVAQRDTIPDQ